MGIQKVEVINNEVIAAGQSISNSQQVVLVHCRVTTEQLEFTVRSTQSDLTQTVVQDLNTYMTS